MTVTGYFFYHSCKSLKSGLRFIYLNELICGASAKAETAIEHGLHGWALIKLSRENPKLQMNADLLIVIGARNLILIK